MLYFWVVSFSVLRQELVSFQDQVRASYERDASDVVSLFPFRNGDNGQCRETEMLPSALVKLVIVCVISDSIGLMSKER